MPQFFQSLSQLCCGTGDHVNDDNPNKKKKQQQKVKGTVVLMKKNVLEFNDYVAGFEDRLYELLGMKVSFQLVSAVNADPGNMNKGKLSEPAYLEDWLTKLPGLKAGDSVFKITFDWDESIGLPGAFIIKNHHHTEFFLKSLTLEDVPNHGKIHFDCHSWVYPAKHYSKDRIFFSNKTYLPHQTPEPLGKYREEELETLRGTGEGELKEWDRVYDYAVYNDLGDPDKGAKYVRPILGGSSEHPYPRRGRTGRRPMKTDPKCESRIPLLMSINIYVPRDERFGHVKLSDFLSYSLKAVTQNLFPGLDALFDETRNEFDSFQDVLNIYKRGIPLTKQKDIFKKNDHKIPSEMLPHVSQTTEDDDPTIKFPVPHVIRDNESAWETDEEFTRETLAGVNPVSICRLQEFPPKSKLDPQVYGNQHSKICEADIEGKLDGLTILEAMKHNKLYILDYHDALMPYLRRINTLPTKTYATRTILFLRSDCTLKPLVVELSLPHPDGDVHGVITKIIKPAYDGVDGTIWKLAKAYVGVNDCGVHQLISHWLNTHAAIEPFVIATNRHLSVLHPIHKLLHPHFRDTMNINALARQTLINGGGIFETTVFPGKYALEMSSAVYKNWVFPDQALPKELVKRGMAVEDPTSPYGCKLLIEDYPFAVDGLEIWSAIEKWVKTYCSIYYKSDDSVKEDMELQKWWKEVREEGHGDLKEKSWWPKMESINDLTSSCTIIIWVASALHAAVNFGQYPYAGYLPNRPTISRRFLPEEGTPEYEEMKTNQELSYLKTITSQIQTLLGISLIEVLSRHSSDEVYLGQRDSSEWTSDVEALNAFQKFGEELSEIEQRIGERNSCGMWKNRFGPVNMPYTLLIPSSEAGITAKGIPNSISI